MSGWDTLFLNKSEIFSGLDRLEATNTNRLNRQSSSLKNVLH